MTMAKVAAFASADEAAQYGLELKAVGLNVVISGPLDLVLIDKPGSAIDGWSQSGKTWYLVVGSQQDLTSVE